MIRLTYIFHSGFVVETAAGILVFDYWLDLANVLSKCLSRRGGRHVYVFASHFHEDHFTKDIFGWKQSLDSDVTYILSKDILKHRRADKGEADVWLAKGGTWADENIQVTATGSNDSGVSWIVETEGKRIFHAGDLCNWYARFLADGNKYRQPYSEELGEDIDPVAEEKRFLGELKDIQKIAKGFDLVMFPVDGRIGNGYTLGARQFIERFQVGMFVPMHFVLSGCESAWRMEPFCQEKHVPFWRIACEGDSIVLADGVSIRHTRVEDIPRLPALFSHARSFMLETGNPSQWTAAYPSEELLRKDIGSRDSYVVEDEKQTVIASFVAALTPPMTSSTKAVGSTMHHTPPSTA